MRGIGAVIHFHPPADSSAPSFDFSGMWSSIRDWFPGTTMEEAVQCFLIFYQPDGGTSALNRLKSFLKLKELASPGRQDNFTAERIVGTGETICTIASDKNSSFLPVTLLLSDQEWHTAQTGEETTASPLSSESTDNQSVTTAVTGENTNVGLKRTHITNTQIREWRDLPQETKHEVGGWKKWVQAQGIAIENARRFLSNTGLTPFGIERMQPPERVVPITNIQIQIWRDLPQEAKQEAGGWKKWAQAEGIAITSAGNFLTNTGLTSRGTARLQPSGIRGFPITDRQIQTWRDLSPAARSEAGGLMTWVQAQGIALESARRFLSNTGLTPFGIERLQPSEERGIPITNTQIQIWRGLSQEAKNAAGGWLKWAQAQRIAATSAGNFLTNTGLTFRGAARLQPRGERGLPITDRQIQMWRDLSQEVRNEAGGWMTWSQSQGIAIRSAENFLTNTGLTPLGIERLKPPGERGTSITNTQIQMWRDLSQEARNEAGGWLKWAQAQRIAIGSARLLLSNTGVTIHGMERLQPPGDKGSPITEAQLLARFNMSPEEPHTSDGWATWTQAQGISCRSARKYLTLTDSEMSPRHTSRALPSATVTSASLQASTSAAAASVNPPPTSSGDKRPLPLATEDIPALPAKQIKAEEDPVTWRTHQINNNLPILQHWRDPTISVLEQAEGRKEALQVTLWGTLFNRLPRETKARINQHIRWFLHNEGNHDARMNAMMSVSIPLDDSDGYRGRTVYARTDLAAFTVLGPYSGRLLDSEKVRCEYEKEYGREASNYYFTTRSQERLVSAWPQGNLLSLINSPVFTHRTTEAEARQNVSAVLVGKNIHFYVTTRDISAGEELWFDYGPDYLHFEPGEALRSVQVKEEPPSP
ncbi:SET domain-containing protein-lysine N-methyltransferase [Salmonella enterica subsp. salamae]|nr:SET domain-containing protein-lysine N-methyltransferase [Salmonella enterica subsp. salamae]SQH41059.1 phage-like protein [Salmonella enterica]